jgi:hypothetical protein
MRRRLILAIGGLAIVVGASVFLASRDGDTNQPAPASDIGLETRTVTVGEVDVKIEPRQLDDRGATFHITLDTHSVELDADLTQATLRVGSSDWPVNGWSGDGPGGHHREGDLRFQAAGPSAGTVTLEIPGLPEPVEATWALPS